jgi:type I restriction enzyme S subunit
MVEIETKVQRYKRYKESGISWIEAVPEHWELKRFKHIFKEKKITHNVALNCGSISFGKVVYKDDEKVPVSTKKSYQVLNKGDFLINPLNLNYDLISLRIGLSDKDVVVSSGYIIVQNVTELSKDYYKWLLHIFDIAFMKTLGSGVRQTLSFTHIANSELVFPPLSEQTAIAQFLDDKTTKIDQAINIKQQQISLLKERKQILIHKAVTRGLYDSVQLKDSGVEWIGEIPEHWLLISFRRISNLQQGLQIAVDKRLEEPSKDALEYITTKSIHNPNNPKHYVTKPKENVICDYQDVLLGRTGNTGEVVTNVRGVFHNNFFKIVYDKKRIQRDFLVNYLNTQGIQKLIMLSAGVTTIPDLNHGDFLSLPFVLPQLSEQKEISVYIETASQKIETAISLKQQEIAKLKEYKSSLINGVVTGKVKVC